jgi:nuclear pore complex protein Nup62
MFNLGGAGAAGSPGGFKLGGGLTGSQSTTATGGAAGGFSFGLAGGTKPAAAPLGGQLGSPLGAGLKLGGGALGGGLTGGLNKAPSVGGGLGGALGGALGGGLGAGGFPKLGAGLGTTPTPASPATTTATFGTTTPAKAATGLGLGLGLGLAGALGTTGLAGTGSTTSTPAAAPTGLAGLAGLAGSASSTTTASPALGATVTATATATATANANATAAASVPTPITFKVLEDYINKWMQDLDTQEKDFIDQATQLNALDKLMIENGEKIIDISSEVQRLNTEQDSLEQELNFVFSQQNDLELAIGKLESDIEHMQPNGLTQQLHAHHNTSDTSRIEMYKLLIEVDNQLKTMSMDMRDIVKRLNDTDVDLNDPVVQISKILNAHMDSLSWIEENTLMIQNDVENVSMGVQDRLRETEGSSQSRLFNMY